MVLMGWMGDKMEEGWKNNSSWRYKVLRLGLDQWSMGGDLRKLFERLARLTWTECRFPRAHHLDQQSFLVGGSKGHATEWSAVVVETTEG